MTITFRSVLVTLLLGCGASGFLVHRLQGPVQAQSPPRTRLDERIDNTVRERGTIESARSVELRCEVGGNSTILFVAPEGSHAKKGDLLVELDDAILRDKLAVAEIQVEQSKAQLVQSQADVKSVTRESVARIELAEQSLRIAELSSQRTLAEGGELAYELTATIAQSVIAKARLQSAESLLHNSNADRGSKTVEDLRLAIVEARETIKVAEARKLLLDTFDRKYKTAVLELTLSERRMSLAQLKSKFEESVSGMRRLSEGVRRAITERAEAAFADLDDE